MPSHPDDERFRELTHSMLLPMTADEIWQAVVSHVHIKAGLAPNELFHALPPAVRAIYATGLVELEVCNGGFNQFFFNSSGEYAEDALVGFELLAAHDHAALMRSAIATFALDSQRLEPFYREHTLESLSESYRHTELIDIDPRYFALPRDLSSIWVDFVATHPDAFGS